MQMVVDGAPWTSMMEAADVVGPKGSRAFGYRIVHRAIRAGLVKLDTDHPIRGSSGNNHGALVKVEQE